MASSRREVADGLDAAAIRAALGADARGKIATLEVLDRIPSTNDHLLAAPPPPAGQVRVCLADAQTRGRGRRGRRWVAGPGACLCLSLGWRYAGLPPQASALSLAVGVGVLHALETLRFRGIALKWPNDLVVGEAKLGGILVELRGPGTEGATYVVAGVGINLALTDADRERIRGAGRDLAVDLTELGGGVAPDRNAVAAAGIDALIGVFEEFGRSGFAPFLGAWRAADALAGRRVEVEADGGRLSGRARGIDDDGALLVEIDGRTRAIRAGEATLSA